MVEITKTIVGYLDGKDICEYALENTHGMEARIISYGAIVSFLSAPDRNGEFEDIVLGFEDPSSYWTEPYLSNCCYLGAIVGRYGNRIANGKFKLRGEEYSLAVNNGTNHLHGGLKGFDKVVWDSEGFVSKSGPVVLLSHFSEDGNEGYPGGIKIEIKYTLTNDNELRIDYSGSIDRACPVNLTHHGYFNLVGGGKTNILSHEIKINATKYTIVDQNSIPTGEFGNVRGTSMDFVDFHTIGERIDLVKGGYDHNYVLSDDVMELRQVVSVREPISGRHMDVLTTEPGLQFYTGNYLNGLLIGRGNVRYNKHWGFCIETQHFPDSPNQPGFPDTTLEPGKRYRQTTVYRF
ncbi:MAG: galactose mutarotase [Bacteroidales bacterium]|nr:galactose mutarotase [Bacteroidales bacterium]